MKVALVGVEVVGLEPHDCSCIKCKSMCLASPCFPTPEEVVRLEKMGFGDQLSFAMFLNPDTLKVEQVVAPKSKDGGFFNQCVFHTTDGMCELHELGLKPTEGRLAHHDQPHENTVELRLALCDTWRSDLGNSLIEKYNPEHEKAVAEMEETIQDIRKIAVRELLGI